MTTALVGAVVSRTYQPPTFIVEGVSVEGDSLSSAVGLGGLGLSTGSPRQGLVLGAEVMPARGSPVAAGGEAAAVQWKVQGELLTRHMSDEGDGRVESL